MKWVQPWFLRMMACHSASRGPPMRMASGSSDSERGLARVVLQQRLVAAHARVVVDVAGLGHAHRGVDEQVGLDAPCAARRVSSKWARCIGLRVWNATTLRQPEALELVRAARPACGAARGSRSAAAARGPRPGRRRATCWCARKRWATPGCVCVDRAVDRLGLALAVVRPLLLDVEHGEHARPRGRAARAGRPADRLRGQRLGDVERDRHRPQRAVGAGASPLATDSASCARHEAGRAARSRRSSASRGRRAGAGSGPRTASRATARAAPHAAPA